MPINPLRPRRSFSLAGFDPAPLDFADEDALVLDDVVASIGPAPEPGAVISVPTAGELHRTIERHLRSVGTARAQADAAGELRDALAQLRRSVA